jgi:anti-sigma-K factor RskA
MPEGDDRFDDDDLAELREVMARTDPRDVEWEEPPPGLWDRIAAATTELDRAAATSAPPVRSRRRWLIAAGLAAAAAIVVVAVGLLRDGDDPSRVVSAVDLAPLGETGSGRAELVDRDGALQLRLETSDVDAGDGYLELWLIDPTVSRLVSLGPLRADGVYDVPASVDPAEFPIVDVSVEPADGDPTHSGDSVLRGQLPL